MPRGEGEQYLIFTLGGEFFGMKLRYVKRVIPFEGACDVPLSRENFDGLVRFEGKAIPLYNLLKAMGVEGSVASGENLVAVERIKGEDIGLLIEGVKKVARLEPDVIEESEDGMAGVKKTANWDGKEVRLLDAEELIFSSNCNS